MISVKLYQCATAHALAECEINLQSLQHHRSSVSVAYVIYIASLQTTNPLIIKYIPIINLFNGI